MATIITSYPNFTGGTVVTADGVTDEVYITLESISPFGTAIFEGDYDSVADAWSIYLPEGYTASQSFFVDYEYRGQSGDLTVFNIYDADGVNLGNIAVKGVVTRIEAVCFTAGTMVQTPNGQTRIEDLAEGDLVQTKDHGARPIRWIGKSTYTAETLQAFPHLRPVNFAAGALGENAATSLSPHHRVLLSDWRAEALFGEAECLATARSLVNDSTITVASGDEDVEYFHILFDDHEIICADGLWSESFHPASLSQGTAAEATRDEVLAIFPELENEAATRPAARPTLSDQDVAVLVN